MLLVGVFDAINNNYGTGMYVHMHIYKPTYTHTKSCVCGVLFCYKEQIANKFVVGRFRDVRVIGIGTERVHR